MLQEKRSLNCDKQTDAENNDDDMSQSQSTENESNDHHIQERKTLAREETKRIRNMKIILIALMFLAASATSVGVYLYAKSEEEQEFEDDFHAHANKIFQSFHTAVGRKMGVLDTLATSMTSYALANNLTFPFVTLPHYEVRGSNIRVLSEGNRMDYTPIVTDENRQEWEQYTKDNHNWLDEAIQHDYTMRQMQDQRYGLSTDVGIGVDGTVSSDSSSAGSDNDGTAESETTTFATGSNNFYDTIYGRFGDFGFSVEEEGSGPFLPVWQISPAAPTKGLLNFNLLHSSSRDTVVAAMETNQAVLGKAIALRDPGDSSAQAWNSNFLKALQRSQYRHELEALEGDPSSQFVYPVFDSFDISNRSLVGLIRTSIFWREYFTDIMSESSRGSLICVLSNTQNQTFSYRIDGPSTTFLGPGDHHDSRFNKMKLVEDTAAENFQNTFTIDKTSYTQVNLNTDFCGYTLSLYPSQDMEDAYLTWSPYLFAGIVVLVFIVTSSVFLTYDYLVEKRQQMVMDRAIASGAIVSSLFPTNVKERLMEDQEAIQTKERSDQMKPRISMWKTEYIRNSIAGDAAGDVVEAESPIVDLYENATVLFGDLVGFTSWSASRKPEEVFLLLETLYGAFDKSAQRRKVYKVETIGDCYVAVTGVPNPQVDHARIMVKFARGCLTLLKEVTETLSETLGEETLQLQMRIGIHSGSVTGGVLRGQRSRFQLFGDTMNTASRCESNGYPGRIQITEATATLLSQRGLGGWIIPREDLVEAKGKGKMQTYWIKEVANGSSSGTDSGPIEYFDDIGDESNELYV